MSKFIKFTAVTLAFGVILSSFLAFNFLNQNIKAQAAQLNTSDFTLPAGYSICAVQDNNQLNTGIKVASGTVLNPSITGTKYSLYAVNSTLCNLATSQNSSAPFTFYSYSNHSTNLKINSLTPGNPPILNVGVEYPNLPPIYSAPNNSNSKTFNLCVDSNPFPVTFSLIDEDKDTLVKSSPSAFSVTAKRSVDVKQGAGFVDYTVTPTQEFLNTPSNFTITTTAKEEVIGNLNQIIGFGTQTTTQSIVFNSKICTSSASSLILSSSILNSSSGIISSSDLSSSVSSLFASSKISSSSQTPNSLTSSSNLISSSSNNYSLSQSFVNSISSALSSSLSSNSSASSCTLPIPPNANTCLNNSSKSSSSISPDGVLIISNSSISISTQSSSTQQNSISSQSSVISDSSQSSNISSSSSQNICVSSQSNQPLADSELESNDSPEDTNSECVEPDIKTGGGMTVTNNGGGIITISNFNSTDSSEPSNFSIDDPYICGEALQGQVFSDNLDNLDKVYLNLESTIDSNLVYTILPNINSDGTYQFGTIGIEPSSYEIIYYAINKDGTQTESQSYIAEIKPKKDCVSLQNLSEDNRQRGVLDYTYSPIAEENINVETLTKIAQANHPQLTQKSNNEPQSLVRTGGEKPQSLAAIILVLIVIIWLLRINLIKSILVNKTNQNLRFLMTLSILTTSISMSGIFLGGNVLYQVYDQNKLMVTRPIFVLCMDSGITKNKALQNLTLPYI